MTQHTIFVCTSCASTWESGKRVGESGGEKLLQKLSEFSENGELETEFSIQAVSCMSACKRACVVAFSAENKPTYIFGDLPAENAVHSVLDCANQYYAMTPQEKLAYKKRPELLRKGIIACIPPQFFPEQQSFSSQGL
ncbi:MAG: DUF1636 domain-containing protein [Limnoraphis robusta]|jgi:predicted metal-binding protein